MDEDVKKRKRETDILWWIAGQIVVRHDHLDLLLDGKRVIDGPIDIKASQIIVEDDYSRKYLITIKEI
jgi:hypothetical protein